MENWVDNQHKSWQNSSEEAAETLLLYNLDECRDGAWWSLLPAALEIDTGLLLSCSLASVDDPDWVGDEDSRRSSDGACCHRLERAQARLVC